MRINDVNLGGGLYRLDVEKSCCEPTPPTSVMDNIMRDVVSRMKGESTCGHPNHPWGCGCHSHTPRPTVAPTCGGGIPKRSYAELDRLKACGEPDGFDAHIDRPRQADFRTYYQWADAMAKYRCAEDAVKACDWPTREPMKGAPAPKPTPRPRVAPRPTRACRCTEVDPMELLGAIAELIFA